MSRPSLPFALLLLLAACTQSARLEPDATSSDGDVEAGPIDGATDGSPLDAMLDGEAGPDAAPPTGARIVAPVVEHDFGPVPIGESRSITLHFRNVGDAPSGELVLSLVGDGDFSFGGDTCFLTVLPPGGECEVMITFIPSDLGAKRVLLHGDAAPGGDERIELLGMGVHTVTTRRDATARPWGALSRPSAP